MPSAWKVDPGISNSSAKAIEEGVWTLKVLKSSLTKQQHMLTKQNSSEFHFVTGCFLIICSQIMLHLQSQPWFKRVYEGIYFRL